MTLAGLALIGTLAAHGAPQAAAAEPLLRPTPLVLKDGRIANVSIHVLPFAPGQAELAAAPAAYLADLTRAVGTDCFLTAQVIGHIASSEVAEDDILNAHRLARARADAVQASLIDGGLPAKAIASVWDWQFMVREPRATVWVFELTAGEDCEGRPLHGDLVAQAPSPTEQPAAAPERPTTPAERPTTPAERPTTPAERAAAPAPNPAVVAQAETAPRVVESPAGSAQAEPGEAAEGAPGFTQPAAVAEPQQVARAEPAEQRAATTAPRRARPVRAGEEGKVEPDPEGGLIITFANNSSYFPSGAAARLRELIAGINADSRYEVTLQAAVSGTTKVVGAKSADEAARYNKWLAERRLERVQDWLVKNAGALSIKPEYVAGDDSRQVTVRVVPVG